MPKTSLSQSLPTPPTSHDSIRTPQSLLFFCALSVFGGLLVGALGAAFRIGLTWAEEGRTSLIFWASQWPDLGWVFPLCLGLFTAMIARYFAGKFPLSAGSGIPHVEAIFRDEATPVRPAVLVVKFFGGIASIGGGLALGREGPTIQMGSIIGTEIARWFRLPREIMRDIQAALGGAGLGVAFNAPIGGALFVFEEVAKTSRTRLALFSLGGLAGALFFSRLLLGNSPVFSVGSIAPFPSWQLPLCLLLGGFLGWAGTFYNRSILLSIDWLNGFSHLRPEWKAGIIGAFAGIVAWFAPTAAGSGEILTNAWFASQPAIGSLLVLLILRWALGSMSYASGTPGGLFAPLLLIGAGAGILFSQIFTALIPCGWEISATPFAIVGMVAFFTGTIRAPLTGIALIAEMTGADALLLPMLTAAFSAHLVADLTGNPPIYDSLRERMLAQLSLVSEKSKSSSI